eukprot:TRINITY_DN36934_c0_g1_i1.p1 TRINITY_DN36934_c0_g1~~TRINITY_DN36934_c0_g1_i1.p1  ORF type:complete len:767 (+),score=145.21 TRINITY_DN36934_c0_g1_i1:55-2301(+)
MATRGSPGDRRAERGSGDRGQWRRSSSELLGGLDQGSYNGFKMAVAVIVFHFGVKLLVQFADILLPFIMALLLVTVLEHVKQVTMEVLECTLVLIFSNISICSCCIRTSRKGGSGTQRGRKEINELMKRILLLLSIVITIALAGRVFWLIGRIVWLSAEAVIQDFEYYQDGVQKRAAQVQIFLRRFHLEKKAQLDMQHLGDFSLGLLKNVAEFLSQHVFYTVTQVSLTTIFVLFLLYSPVQRDFSPMMQGVFESMELYLKLKTFVSFMMGITNGIALAIIGLELPAAWGLLTFLANFIPNIGGPVMSILPCVIALLDVRKSFYQVSAAFIAQFFLHFNIANFVEPVVFGTTEKIHSVVVLIGLSFFGYIWGFTGMFLSVPLLFAMHAWLDLIARKSSSNQEAREDALTIMGLLEGRWLADIVDTTGEDETVGGVNLLTGQIEAEGDSWPNRDLSHRAEYRQGLPVPEHQPPTVQEVHATTSVFDWAVTGKLKELFAVRDSQTEEIRMTGLLLRWVVLAGFYTLVFFGWDLSALIHSSPGVSGSASQAQAVARPDVTSLAPSSEVATTTTVASIAKAVAAAAAAFPFQAPPKLDSEGGAGEEALHNAEAFVNRHHDFLGSSNYASSRNDDGSNSASTSGQSSASNFSSRGSRSDHPNNLSDMLSPSLAVSNATRSGDDTISRSSSDTFGHTSSFSLAINSDGTGSRNRGEHGHTGSTFNDDSFVQRWSPSDSKNQATAPNQTNVTQVSA